MPESSSTSSNVGLRFDLFNFRTSRAEFQPLPP